MSDALELRSDQQVPAIVTVNGVLYVPAHDRPMREEAGELLRAVYGKLWVEAYYNPTCEATCKFAKPLADMMTQLNRLLGFKK